MRQVVEARLCPRVLELLDAEHLRRRPRGGRARGAAADACLERRRDRHRCGSGQARCQALSDRACHIADRIHAGTSSASRAGLPLSASAVVVPEAPSRSSRWSPTRSEFAIAVSAGFTALDDGKKLVSTTYRLSSSCALQLTSRAELAGSSPKRTVPLWWATPASGIRWSSTKRPGIGLSWQPSSLSSPFSFRSSRLCASRL